MLDSHDNRTITANVHEVLEALEKNFAEHKRIVEEARAGYLDKAEAALQKRLGQLREGKVVGLRFTLKPPQDHSNQFVTIIKMLELHRDAHLSSPKPEGPATIELKAVDVQRFILNDWSWTDSFLVSNSPYSAGARQMASGKALI